jgi:hypothetical protein
MPDTAADRQRIAQLKAMQESYDNAPVGGFGDPLQGIEDDDYQGRVDSWDMFPGKKNPNALYLKMVASIQHHPELAGRPIDFLFDVTDPDKLGFLKDHFYNLGVSELDMTQLAPGSELLNELLDVPVLIGVYTNKKGYRNAVIRKRLDGEVHSDLGTAQEQIAGFEAGDPDVKKPKGKGKPGGALAAVEEGIERNFRNKPEGCICPDPTKGQFDDTCTIPGHGINF